MDHNCQLKRLHLPLAQSEGSEPNNSPQRAQMEASRLRKQFNCYKSPTQLLVMCSLPVNLVFMLHLDPSLLQSPMLRKGHQLIPILFVKFQHHIICGNAEGPAGLLRLAPVSRVHVWGGH